MRCRAPAPGWLDVFLWGPAVGEHKSSGRIPMRKLLTSFVAAILLALPLGKLTATPLPNQEMKELKKRHKEQRKMLKQQQHTMKKVMGQHAQSSDSRMRFKHDLKMQRQMLRKSQEAETRRLKENHESVKQLHPPT